MGIGRDVQKRSFLDGSSVVSVIKCLFAILEGCVLNISSSYHPFIAEPFLESNDQEDGDISLRITEADYQPPSRITLPLDTLWNQLRFASAYLDCDSGARSIHERSLLDMAGEIASKLTLWIGWVNSQLASTGHRINLFFLDGHVVDAYVQEDLLTAATERTSVIRISLGSLPMLFGVANRLARTSSTRGTSGMARAADQYEWERFSRWNPSEDPTGILDVEVLGNDFEHTYQIASDAFVLMLLHEVAHACQGHASLDVLRNRADVEYANYRRAAEADADWGAGWLFMHGQQVVSEIGESKEKRVERLAYAANCHYISFQFSYRLTNNVNQLYHLPATRSRCTLLGGRQEWTGSGDTDEVFVNTVNAAFNEMPLLDLLGPLAIPNWISEDDEQVAEDYVTYETISLPLISQISRKCESVRTSPWGALRSL